MPMHISYAKKELTDKLRASQPAKAALAQGTQYSLLVRNRSAQPWLFYVYQKLPSLQANIFSLAWFCSPYQIQVGDQIRFTWEIDYNFIWSDTGVLIPGVDFEAWGMKDCSPDGKNTTEFSAGTAPGLSQPVQAPPSGSLVVKDADNVPNNKFSVGLGMSGTGTYCVQAGTNLTHTFTPTPSYWVAAGTNLKIGTVLSINTITQTAEAKFPSAVYSLDCVLQDNNEWDIQPA
ncbi:protein rhiA [Bradyrhizobium barranii]|uniref:Protein rhiA n=1 Tax=Bradyrhizobium barranii TaxID=2992140 RepID=A0ABY3QTI8_9BRAD|nr:protein rhiA [Bradyrhizobium japonicum]UFW88381.1 protein rhiA [Bradyrhizobium japonicum]